MQLLKLETERLNLQLASIEETRVMLDNMPPEVRREVSADWLAQIENAIEPSPWIHGFTIELRDSGKRVGSCGFKAPPNADGMVEIAYGLDPAHQGLGYATEAAKSLTDFALQHEEVAAVRAHTLPENNASTRVLTKCGFDKLGEVTDPDDGRVWRWEKR